MNKDNPDKEGLRKLPERLSAYLSQMESDDRAFLEALFQTTLIEAQEEFELLDLWDSRELPVTYWVLLLTGVNQEEEMEIANVLLSWKEFFSKNSARVICVQSSERNAFRCCSAAFEVVNCPTLIFSDSPDMWPFIKIESELLFKLASQKGGLQRFLTKIQSIVENGGTLIDVENMLLTDKFWSALKIVHTEVKSFVSIK